ncbi:MAG TPA: DUF2267 domain-containing protein [Xanthobacteraceae bacterium]
MSELVDRVVSNVGLDRPTAEKAVGIILDFLSTEGPADKVRDLLAGLPGSEALLQAAHDDGGAHASVGGIMGVGSRLMAAGLNMGEIQSVTRELMAHCRERGAGDTLADIASAIPGLSQFM